MAHDDKTEAPTPKRKREAKRDGKVPKSQELTTWGSVFLASYLLPMTLGAAAGSTRDILTKTTAVMAEPENGAAVGLLGAAGRAIIVGVTPLAIGMAAFAIIGNLAQTGLVFSSKKLKPSAEKINPLKGFKRLFSAESAWNLLKVLLRTSVLALAAWIPLSAAIDRYRGPIPPLRAMLPSVGGDAVEMVRLVAAAGLLLGAVDYIVVRRRITKSLKMTKQEVKDEAKQSDGDPQMKGLIRQRQRELGRNRMIAAVADASVVIVNPTHVAVALKYEPGGGAPRLVAKGKDAVATRIRERAEATGVPMVRDIPLAWALHDTCELDHPIPAELFAAVAKVLAFVMTVGKRSSSVGGIVSLNPA